MSAADPFDDYDPNEVLPIQPVAQSGGPSRGARPGVPAGAGSRRLVVVSESPMPLTGYADGVSLIMVLALLVLGYAVWSSGVIGHLLFLLLDGALGLLWPLLLLLVLLAVLPVFARVILGSLLNLVVQVASLFGATLGRAAGRGGCLGGPGTATGGLSLICRLPNAREREVRVHSDARVPAGSVISVFGPTLLGRKAAWVLVNHTHRQTVIGRGIAPAIVLIALTGSVCVGLLPGGHG